MGSATTTMESAAAASLRKLLDADHRTMGFDRGELIRDFARRAGSLIYETDDAIALVLYTAAVGAATPRRR